MNSSRQSCLLPRRPEAVVVRLPPAQRILVVVSATGGSGADVGRRRRRSSRRRRQPAAPARSAETREGSAVLSPDSPRNMPSRTNIAVLSICINLPRSGADTKLGEEDNEFLRLRESKVGMSRLTIQAKRPRMKIVVSFLDTLTDHFWRLVKIS